jgi:alpha-L-rhamnosidase
MSIAGIRPTSPGFARCTITPRPGDLENLKLTARTVRGDIAFHALGRTGDRELRLRIPAGIEAELRLDKKEHVALMSVPQPKHVGTSGFRLPTEKDIVLHLKHT